MAKQNPKKGRKNQAQIRTAVITPSMHREAQRRLESSTVKRTELRKTVEDSMSSNATSSNKMFSLRKIIVQGISDTKMYFSGDKKRMHW